MRGLPILLLLAGAIRHLTWGYVSQPALWWNAMGGLMVLALLAIIWQSERKTSAHLRALALVMLWISYEEVLVVGCSFWRMFDWWPALPQEELCSSRLGFQLGSASLVLLGALIVKVSHDRSSRN